MTGGVVGRGHIKISLTATAPVARASDEKDNSNAIAMVPGCQ